MISTDRPGRQERQFDLDSTYSELTNSRLHRSRYRSRSHQVYPGCSDPQRQRMGSMGESTFQCPVHAYIR